MSTCTHMCAHIYNLTTYWNYLNTELHKAKIFLSFYMLPDVVCVLQSLFKEESMPKSLRCLNLFSSLFLIKFYRAQRSLRANDRIKLAQFLIKEFVG